MKANHAVDLVLVTQEEDTPTKQGETSKVKEPTARRKNLVEEKPYVQIINIDKSAVSKKVHPGIGMYY